MVAKVLATTSILMLACSLTFAQGGPGCTQIHTWGQSGAAGSLEEGPGGSSTWQQGVKNLQAMFGGIGPICTYWLIYDGSWWNGSCYSVAYTCNNPPVPPPGSAPETAPGQSCPYCGSPIALASGNTYISQNDLTIPGIGGGLKLTRTWNSMWPPTQTAFRAGLFGSNWRSTYEERVFVGSDGTMKYSRSDGSYWSFLLYGSPAAYHVVAPANAQATLTEQGTTTWTIVFGNGEQRLFDYNSGLLLSIADRNGNTTALGYDSLNRLITVTDPAARHLYFSYTGSSSYLVSGVTSDVGISLSYGYDSQGRLLTFTKPDQTTVSFQYDSNSFITSVKDQQGKILESHTYDSAGHGLTSSRANGVESVSVSYGSQ